MLKRKAAAKKKKTSGARKSVTKGPRRKSVAKKNAKSSAARKKPLKKKPSKKKTATSRKKTAKRATSKKKPARAKTSKKKGSSKKKPVGRKQSTSKKRPSSKKRVSAKKGASSKAPARRPSVKKPSTKRGGPRRTDLLSSPSAASGPYKRKRGESYMNAEQLEHFRQLLSTWKRELMEEVDRTMLHMKDEAANFPDPNDRATQESEFGLELRTRDRERKLLRKIDAALQRVDDGSYGYCEETGEEIGLRRLEARPVATLCVEAQERRELAERQYRDREDQYR